MSSIRSLEFRCDEGNDGSDSFGTQIAICQCPFVVIIPTALSGRTSGFFGFRKDFALPRKTLDNFELELDGLSSCNEVKLVGGGSFVRRKSDNARTFRESASDVMASRETLLLKVLGKFLELTVAGRNDILRSWCASSIS